MVNNISRDSNDNGNPTHYQSKKTGYSATFTNQPGYSVQKQALPKKTRTQNAIPVKNKTTEIFNETTHASRVENATSQKKLISGEEPKAEITAAMLDELAHALQYELPIAALIRKAPTIVNTQLNNGMLPLHFAIHYGKPEAVELLLEVTDLQLRDAKGFDAFDHAVQEDNTDVAKKIMKANMEKEWTTVQKSYESVQKVHEENPALKVLLKDFPEEVVPQVLKNIQPNVLRGSPTHNSLLALAIANSDYKAFVRAVTAGADIATQDPATLENLLHLAMKSGQEEIIYLLMDAAPGWRKLQDSQGITPLQIAEASNKPELIDLVHFIDFKQTLEEIESEFPALKKHQTEIADISEIFEGNKIEIDTRLEILEKNKTEAGAELGTLQKSTSDIASQLEVWEKKYSEVDDELKTLQKIDTKISTWDSILGFFFPKTLKNKIETIAKLDILKTNKALIESNLEALKTNKTELEARPGILEKYTLEIEAEIGTWQKNKAALEIELATLEKYKVEIAAGFEMLEKTKTETQAKLEDLNNPKIESKLKTLGTNIKDYRESYISKLESLPENERLQLHSIAIHGVRGHPEGSQGHNQFVLGSIINHDLEQLVLLASLGASFNTTSVTAAKALEDPMGYGSTFRGIQETNAETFRSVKNYLWSDPTAPAAPGQGKSLLDMAVYYANDGEDEQKSLQVIAYLLALGLDPMKINDEGESPFSMALLKGNYKAALLMAKNPEANEGMLERTYLLLKEGSKLRDPLAVTSSKSTQAVFAAAYLLTSMYASNSVLSYINYIPFILSAFGGLFSSGSSFREKLMPSEPVYVPEIVKNAVPFISKAALLEIAILSRYPTGILGLTAFSVYTSAMEAFQGVKTAVSHVAERPLSAAYKFAMETLPLPVNALRFKTMVSNMFFPPTAFSKNRVNCDSINNDDFTNMTTAERVGDKRLDPRCVNHAKVILGVEAEHFKAPKQNYIKDLFKKGALGLHPDKGGDDNLFKRFAQAKTKLLEPRALPELAFIEPKKTFSVVSTLNSLRRTYVGDAAIKTGIIWGTSTDTFNKKVPGAQYFWPGVVAGSVGYTLGLKPCLGFGAVGALGIALASYSGKEPNKTEGASNPEDEKDIVKPSVEEVRSESLAD